MNIQSALVKSILDRHESYEWSVQGFGFVRTKIADVGRIHVWDSRLAVDLVSTMHTHPWPLKSTIISGELVNQRFMETAGLGMPYMHSIIATGEGGGLVGVPDEVPIFGERPEFYKTGDVYEQTAGEIHRSMAQDGTVTLMERPQGDPLQECSVFWPRGLDWVSAEPKPIHGWELSRTIATALARWAPR